MGSDFIKYRKGQYIVPIKLINKKQYYYDLMNIENSFTGRLDVLFANTFIAEANKLLINSIELFEMGYFDCSFYSLRQALELATTMIYLVEIDKNEKEEKLNSWKNQGRFPMYKQMHEYLKINGNVYIDIKEKLEDYFSELNKLKIKLNKYVHKQGEETFYIFRNRINPNKEKIDLFRAEYEQYLVKCIGAVAIFRLVIDPLPALLNDEDIYNRTPDFMTEGYKDDFIEKYIGKDVFEMYKQTRLYSDAYDHIINQEERPQSVVDLIKYQFIDNKRIDEILRNSKFLSQIDLLAVTLASFSKKIVNIYFYGGFNWYYTKIKSKRTSTSFDSRVFKKFEELSKKENLEYEEVYLTCFEFKDEKYYIEHNEKFTEEEVAFLNMLNELPNKLNEFTFNSQKKRKD